MSCSGTRIYATCFICLLSKLGVAWGIVLEVVALCGFSAFVEPFEEYLYLL